jgi:nucleotide-binding universal stress UspA family protein
MINKMEQMIEYTFLIVCDSIKDLCNFSQANNKKEKPGANMTIGISKIMVGIDGSKESVNAADYAIAIAKRHNAELIAVNVLTSDIGYAYSSPGVESPPLTIREIILLAEDEVKKWFDDIKEKADRSGIRFRSEIIMAKRSEVSTILDYAEEQNINLIAVGTRGRSGIKKMLLGSVASGLVTYAACLVLVVK